MNINSRVAEIEVLNGYLGHRLRIEKLEPNTVLVTIDYWTKRTLGSDNQARIYTERYVVENYKQDGEVIWKDDTTWSNAVKTKQW